MCRFIYNMDTMRRVDAKFETTILTVRTSRRAVVFRLRKANLDKGMIDYHLLHYDREQIVTWHIKSPFRALHT
jgi:hypothetical protein